MSDQHKHDFESRSFDEVDALDRRASPRFSDHLRGDEPVEIWLDNSLTVPGSLLDESLQGIGLTCQRPDSLFEGKVVDVIYRGRRKQAEVRYVRDHYDDDNQSKIGLIWR